MIKAVIFDMDGVLTDSIDLWFHSFNDLLKDYGKPAVTKNEFLEKHWGNPYMRDLNMKLGDNHGIDLKKYVALFSKYFEKNRKELRFYDGVTGIISAVEAKGLKTAICTNTPSQLVPHILKGTGITAKMQVIIGGEMVKNAKPAPDSLLLACKKLGVKPQEALYIGDTPHDVAAGKAAGCKMIAITNSYTAEKLVGADTIINNLNEIISYI